MEPVTTTRNARRKRQQTPRLTKVQRIRMAAHIAIRRPTWRLAVDAIISHGLATSIAEADDLLYEAKQLGLQKG